MNSSASAFWRMLISACAIAAIAFLRKTRGVLRPDRRDTMLLVLSGFFFAADLALLHVAIFNTTVVNATLLNNLAPPIAGGLMALAGRRQSGTFWLGGVVALAGAAVLAGPDLRATATPLGVTCGLLSAFFFAGYLIVNGELRKRNDLTLLLQWGGLATAAFLLPLALIESGRFVPASVHGWGAVIALGIVVQCGGQGLLLLALKRVSGPRAGLTVLLAPVFAALLAAWIFDEQITGRVIAGGLAVLAGIVISAWPRKPPAAVPSPGA